MARPVRTLKRLKSHRGSPAVAAESRIGHPLAVSGAARAGVQPLRAGPLTLVGAGAAAEVRALGNQTGGRGRQGVLSMKPET
jgi:hypothetical protein